MVLLEYQVAVSRANGAPSSLIPFGSSGADYKQQSYFPGIVKRCQQKVKN